jgi:hypothetical protein
LSTLTVLTCFLGGRAEDGGGWEVEEKGREALRLRLFRNVLALVDTVAQIWKLLAGLLLEKNSCAISQRTSGDVGYDKGRRGRSSDRSEHSADDQ